MTNSDDHPLNGPQRLHYIKSKSGPKTLMTDTLDNVEGGRRDEQ
jgi:hypothetical protein